jgi:hypothetical protein
MPLLNIVTIKRVHKNAVIRRRIKNRMKDVLRLLIVRGAYVVEGSDTIQFSDEKKGDEMWLKDSMSPLRICRSVAFSNLPAFLKDWSYTFIPSLEAYRAPLPLFIAEVSSALKILKARATSLDHLWSRDRLDKQNQMVRKSQTAFNPLLESKVMKAQSITDQERKKGTTFRMLFDRRDKKDRTLTKLRLPPKPLREPITLIPQVVRDRSQKKITTLPQPLSNSLGHPALLNNSRPQRSNNERERTKVLSSNRSSRLH